MGGQDHCCVINCSNKRKTIKRTGRLLFPIDINDVQSEVDISSESDCETTISRRHQMLPFQILHLKAVYLSTSIVILNTNN